MKKNRFIFIGIIFISFILLFTSNSYCENENEEELNINDHVTIKAGAPVWSNNAGGNDWVADSNVTINEDTTGDFLCYLNDRADTTSSSDYVIMQELCKVRVRDDQLNWFTDEDWLYADRRCTWRCNRTQYI